MATQTTGDIYSPNQNQSPQNNNVGQAITYSTPSTNQSKYTLGDEDYAKLGQEAWQAGNSNAMYGKGWLNLGDYGGSNKYEFAYDDSQNIGQADWDDPMRYLYVREVGSPDNFQKYSLGSSQAGDIDMTELGRQLYAGGNNWLDDFWGSYYGWSTDNQPPSNYNPPPSNYNPAPPQTVTPPAGVGPGQGEIPTNDGRVQVPGPGNPEPLTPDDAVRVGMGGAKDAYQNMLNLPQYYPNWWGEEFQRLDPSQYMDQYPEWLDVPDYEGITLPEQYKGLMEGDYDRLETALRTPGDIAAQRAFEQGGNYLKDIMGSSGMYGSSVMAQQANQGLNKPYMDALATNAANAVAQRYGLQQGDMQFGANYGLQLADLAQQDLMNQYRSDMTARNLLGDYNTQKFQFGYGLDEASRGEYNNLLQNRFNYDLAAQEWRNALNERYMNAGLALAGQGAPLQQANQNYQLAQERYNQSDMGSLFGGAIDLIDKMGGWSWAGDQVGNIFDSFFK